MCVCVCMCVVHTCMYVTHRHTCTQTYAYSYTYPAQTHAWSDGTLATCYTLQHPQHTATRTATRCSTRHYTATHCNTLQQNGVCCRAGAVRPEKMGQLINIRMSCMTCHFMSPVNCPRTIFYDMAHIAMSMSHVTVKSCHTATHRWRDRRDIAQRQTHCNTLQHTATHCNTLQHNATQCNTMQHRRN